MVYVKRSRIQTPDMIAEKQPAFLNKHPWLVYVNGKIECCCSNYKLANYTASAILSKLRWDWQRKHPCRRSNIEYTTWLVYIDTGEVIPVMGTPPEQAFEQNYKRSVALTSGDGFNGLL